MLVHKLTKHLTSLIRSGSVALRRKTVAAYFYKKLNFGDLLTPEVLNYVGVKSVHVPVARYSNVVGVGSILHMVPANYKGAILGSGFISKGDGKSFPNAKPYLVRGLLTKSEMSNSAETAIGDPGLIAAELFKNSIAKATKKYKVGIIPHYVHESSGILSEILKKKFP